jgi:hypothetical protein
MPESHQVMHESHQIMPVTNQLMPISSNQIIPVHNQVRHMNQSEINNIQSRDNNFLENHLVKRSDESRNNKMKNLIHPKHNKKTTNKPVNSFDHSSSHYSSF